MSSSQHSQEADYVAESPQHELKVYRCGISGNRRAVSSPGDHPRCFVQNASLRAKIPDVTIFDGSDNTGAVIGVCNYTALSSDIIVGRGDPANPNAIVWETLAKSSRDHSVYTITLDGRDGERTKYIWKRTHDASLVGRKNLKVNQRSWKLIDDVTGSVVAVFAARGTTSWRNTGEIRFLEHHGKEWEEWVLLTYFGLSEKARRRAIARRDLSWFM